MLAQRYKNNPILTPKDITPRNNEFEVVGCFNPGVTEFENETLLLIRVAERVKEKNDNVLRIPYYNSNDINILSFDKNNPGYDFSDSRVIKAANAAKTKYLTSMSHLMLAKSSDGINFKISNTLRLLPELDTETFGIEDARITKIDSIYYINYSAVSPLGVCTTLIQTKDFYNFKHMGNIMCPDNKDVSIFPEKIGGKYYALHRPSMSEFSKPEIWLAESDNLLYWGNHRHVMGVRENSWDSSRIGSSSVPMRTDEGWLLLYHGADKDNRYSLGAVILDYSKPWRVLKRTKEPFLEPKMSYETDGFFGNVIFACGCIKNGDELKIYYGAADECICLAYASAAKIIKSMSLEV